MARLSQSHADCVVGTRNVNVCAGNGCFRTPCVEQGEPAYLLGLAVFFALKQAIYAARKENGVPDGWFQLDCPVTPQRAHAACNVSL